MFVRTNALYDAALAPNIGVGVGLGKNWACIGAWEYGWFDLKSDHYFARTYGGSLEFRRYFGRKAQELSYAGHHLGLFGFGMTYDYEFGGTGWQSKFTYGCGLDYGYSFRIKDRVRLDLSIGFGYIGGRYKEYEPMDGCKVWQSTSDMHYFGPNRAEVSFIWLLGKKGGQK